MKKGLAVLVCFVFLAVVAAPSFALPVAGSKSITASATPTGGVQVWDAIVKNISNNSTVNNIAWSGVTAGMPGYKVADQYVEVTATVTNPINWKMIIYTNNTAYTGDKSLGSFGLVNSSNNRGLPLAWRVQDGLSAVAAPVFSTNRPEDGSEGFTDYQWKFLVDKNQTGANGWASADAEKYNRVWDNNGFYWNEGIGPDMDPDPAVVAPSPAPSEDNKVYIYLGAGFAQSLAESYSTSTLTLETLLGL